MDSIKKEDSVLEQRARLFWWGFLGLFLDISSMNSHLGLLLYRKKNTVCLNAYRLHLELKVDFSPSHVSQLSVPERSSEDQTLTCHLFISLGFCLH